VNVEPPTTDWRCSRVSHDTHSARWLAIHDDVVRAAQARGASEDEIADTYSVSPREQRRIARAVRAEAALAAYEAGHKVKFIQEDHRLTWPQLERAREAAGIPRRTRTVVYEAEIRRLHAEGLNDFEIAQALSCCRTTVWDRRRRLGLPRNCRPGGYAR
jgi:DNA-binding NarL/FixJ family response regulator